MHIGMINAIAPLALYLLPTQQAQVKRIEHKLMAPCCYSQTIDEHMSQEAAMMRAEVEQMVENGRSEREILTFYRMKYGETILATPDGLSGILLTVVPLLLFALSCLLVGFLVRRWTRWRLPVHAIPQHNFNAPNHDALVRKIRAEIGDF